MQAQLAEAEAKAARGSATPAAQARNIHKMQDLREKIKAAREQNIAKEREKAAKDATTQQQAAFDAISKQAWQNSGQNGGVHTPAKQQTPYQRENPHAWGMSTPHKTENPHAWGMPTDTLSAVTNPANEFAGLAGTGQPVNLPADRTKRQNLLDYEANAWGIQTIAAQKVVEPWEEKDPRTQSQKAADLGEQPMSWHEHQNLYEKSKQISNLKNRKNDGLVGAGKGNPTGIPWKTTHDEQVHFDNGSIPVSESFVVDGPIRIEPVSNTFGYEGMAISVDWYGLDERGKVIPEVYDQATEIDTYSVGGGNWYGVPAGPGHLDFSPPYPEPNPNGYVVTVTRPGQNITHGNAMGVDIKIYTQEGREPVKKAR